MERFPRFYAATSAAAATRNRAVARFNAMRSSVRNLFRGRDPLPNGDLPRAATITKDYTMEPAGSTETNRGYLFGGGPDSVCQGSNGGAWSAVWESKQTHPLRSQNAVVVDRMRAEQVLIQVDSLLDADTAPGILHYGQIPEDVNTTDLSSKALAVSQLDINGQPLRQMLWGPGSKTTLVWQPKCAGDERAIDATVTSSLANSYADGYDRSRMLAVFTGMPASAQFASFHVRHKDAYSSNSTYTDFVPSNDQFENPQLAAIVRNARKYLVPGFPDESIETLEPKLEGLADKVAIAIDEVGMDDVKSVLTAAKGLGGLAKTAIDIVV